MSEEFEKYTSQATDMMVWRSKDKSEWGDGPWNDEPDKAQWIDEETNLDCLIVRGPGGALCGYVGVPESHPLFDVPYSYQDSRQDDLSPHGGVTFSDRCDPSEAQHENICHTGDVANKLVYWYGFDCAHSGDISPAYGNDGYREHFSSYKSFEYVQHEVSRLAMQLSEVSDVERA